MTANGNPYEVVPRLWIGSKEGDLVRERKKLISKWIEGDQKSKDRIFEITNQLIEIRAGKFGKKR
jgi:hypothetical protein